MFHCASAPVRNALLMLLAAILTGMSGGCAHMNHTQAGALTGTAIGTVAGAMIGGHNGSAAAGAILGGMTGTGVGALAGSAEDAREERDLALYERDAAIAHASYSATVEAPLTNFDLVRLAQSGVSDEVIVNMIQTRGGNFDLGTNSVISLKQNGVSDRVIMAAQAAPLPRMREPRLPPPSSRSSVVIVERPAPTAAVVVGAGPCWGYHHHYRYRSGGHFHYDF